MIDSTIKSTLDGLQRTNDIFVDVTNHHFIVLSQLNEWIAMHAIHYSRGVLLDYGCGGQPYRALLSPYISRYIGADVAQAAGVSIDVELTPGSAAPIPDRSIDTVFSTQTLEHVYDFRAYLEDCYRVLQSDGHLILTVPMHWRHHEVPFDYWRFTRFAVERILSDSGFVVVDIKPCGGLYSVIGQAWLDHMNEKRSLRQWIRKAVSRLALFSTDATPTSMKHYCGCAWQEKFKRIRLHVRSTLSRSPISLNITCNNKYPCPLIFVTH